MKLTPYFLAALLPATILAAPEAEPDPVADPEPEPEIEARQATTGPVSCSIFGQIVSKKLPAPCAVNGPTFAKNTRVTFTCQILTDETWMRVGQFGAGSSWVRRNDPAVQPCSGFDTNRHIEVVRSVIDCREKVRIRLPGPADTTSEPDAVARYPNAGLRSGTRYGPEPYTPVAPWFVVLPSLTMKWFMGSSFKVTRRWLSQLLEAVSKEGPFYSYHQPLSMKSPLSDQIARYLSCKSPHAQYDPLYDRYIVERSGVMHAKDNDLRGMMSGETSHDFSLRLRIGGLPSQGE
ncbi:uncharacterized protein BO95DRAFT_434758 [Aspergillus brunneoviolaceus CBS 621.78]|uniref:Uncharacterized protein n=1 Tax=Aspergillus brunneoviolaceus CBS 621.78 TaxID=1450534 RepID=A0ACD1G083_9EURO|nr:hypothetical protein BO95DRAFT_434758 [Aspergillus brunneoviolaceus CBS 621.78]RAH42622.1 hypothetical protein BO95DRAFT_434758 [Aspergillus brunneoviolaceus CBS 621.78]